MKYILILILMLGVGVGYANAKEEIKNNTSIIGGPRFPKKTIKKIKRGAQRLNPFGKASRTNFNQHSQRRGPERPRSFIGMGSVMPNSSFNSSRASSSTKTTSQYQKLPTKNKDSPYQTGPIPHQNNLKSRNSNYGRIPRENPYGSIPKGTNPPPPAAKSQYQTLPKKPNNYGSIPKGTNPPPNNQYGRIPKGINPSPPAAKSQYQTLPKKPDNYGSIPKGPVKNNHAPRQKPMTKGLKSQYVELPSGKSSTSPPKKPNNPPTRLQRDAANGKAGTTARPKSVPLKKKQNLKKSRSSSSKNGRNRSGSRG